MLCRFPLAILIVLALAMCPAQAQFQTKKPEGASLGDSAVSHWQAGMIISAGSRPCKGLVGTAPVPVDWPEQVVRVVEEDFSPTAKVSYKMVGGTVKQMVVQIPFLPAGEVCRALVTVEITRNTQLKPDDTAGYVLPNKRKLPRNVRPYLTPSPGIESTSAKIKSLARQFDFDQESSAWAKVEGIYDWVRENVEFVERNKGGAMAVLKENQGDHEDLTSLFIALCRAKHVPARTVWVQRFCYAEFYLEDAQGEGHWFPCQVAGARAFGEMHDFRPILQKGDSFRSPNNPRERKRYLPETLNGAGGRPRVKFVRKAVSQ